MRVECIRHIVAPTIAVSALLLVSCALQSKRSVPAPVEERTTQAPAPAPPTAPTPTPTWKPKPTPAPKPETKGPETAPAPLEGIESSKVGYYFDTLQGRLRQLAGTDVVVNRQDDHITLDVTRRVSFGNDSSPTAAGLCAALAPIAKALVEYRMTRVAVDVDAETDDDAGRRTAKSRGESIAQCLADAGVASRRIGSNGIASTAQTPTVTLRIEPIVRSP
jgi:outer membrane protein OmpA-like peptidoglycan-associated protein